jgi:hypothetical protein
MTPGTTPLSWRIASTGERGERQLQADATPDCDRQLATPCCHLARRAERQQCSVCCRSQPDFDLTVSDALLSFGHACRYAAIGRKRGTAAVAGCRGGHGRGRSVLRRPTSSKTDRPTAALRRDGSLPTHSGSSQRQIRWPRADDRSPSPSSSRRRGVLQGCTGQPPGRDPVMLQTGTTILNLRDAKHGGFNIVGDRKPLYCSRSDRTCDGRV